MPENRYPRNCYLMLKQHDSLGRNNWASAIKNLLYSYGFGFVWLNQTVGDIWSVLHHFKQRLIDCKLQNWRHQINYSSRCDTYKQFKLMKGKALRKHSLHEKTTASVLLKLFISSVKPWKIFVYKYTILCQKVSSKISLFKS